MMSKLYKVVETPGKVNAHVWDESEEKKYQFVEPYEPPTEKEITHLINGIIWLGDGGKIMGVPRLVEAITKLIKGER